MLTPLIPSIKAKKAASVNRDDFRIENLKNFNEPLLNLKMLFYKNQSKAVYAVSPCWVSSRPTASSLSVARSPISLSVILNNRNVPTPE